MEPGPGRGPEPATATTAADHNRRALLAALAGGAGLAFAAPPKAKAKGKGKGKGRGKGDKGKQPKPPLAAAVARIDRVAVFEGGAEPRIDIVYTVAVVVFATGGAFDASSLAASTFGGTPEAMRADFVRLIQQNVAALNGGGLLADRVAVLLL